MNVIVNLPQTLKTWIVRNLDRGFPPDQLIGPMVDQRLDPAVARRIVEVFAEARHAGRQITADSLTLDVDVPGYRPDPPRLPPGNTITLPRRAIPVLLRLQRPVFALLGNVLDAAECARLIELARPRLQASTVATGADSNAIVEHRSSDSMFFRLGETPLIAALDERLSAIMNSPVDHGEGLQVIRYGVGAQVTPHFDFLMPSHGDNEQSLRRSGQRISTLVVYLNDVESGGETVFPEAGVTVCALRGQAIYFEYCNSANQLDPLSVHAGAPVLEGEKWALTKWMRQRPFVPA
ncbi:MAG: 2OG-Fe(II) oxygenase [Steroidobacteraceae bacterium]|jgi:prolyl 4-hydroxylase